MTDKYMCKMDDKLRKQIAKERHAGIKAVQNLEKKLDLAESKLRHIKEAIERCHADAEKFGMVGYGKYFRDIELIVND